MDALRNTTYCGLYCRLCSNMSRIPRLASELRSTMAKDGWEGYGEFIVPEFKPFWAVLDHLSRMETECPGCRGGCGDPECAIRICARERNVDLCPLCGEFPCAKVEAIAAWYPNLLADGRRLARIGLEAWTAEQEGRRETGFCLSDIRFPAGEDGKPL